MKNRNILKELRTNKNLTQSQLSSILKIGQATIAGYENGTREPHINILILYANYFQCSIDYLVGREDDFGNITVKTENSAELTSGEQTLLANYKKLPEDLRRLAETYVKKLVSLHETSIPTRIAPVPKTEPQPIPKKKTGITPA